MRLLCFFALCLAISVPCRGAQPASSEPVVNIYIVRSGEQLHSPHRATYRLFEWSQMRGRWIYPDIGYYDSGYGHDQIWFAGGGADLIRGKHFTWEQELYFAQTAGPDAHNERSLWIWPVLDFSFPRHFSAQAVVYPTLPLNHAQPWALDVDRVKLEREIGEHWIAGAGYAASICEGSDWKSKPFATISRKTPAGKFEFWLEQIPGGAQAQVRYLLVTKNRQ